jgi:hypothetical protein
MLRGHGTLKTILGRSVIPAKRRRSSEEEADDDQPRLPAPTKPVKDPKAGRSSVNSENADVDDTAALLDDGKKRCPVCGRCFTEQEVPEAHIGVIEQMQIS